MLVSWPSPIQSIWWDIQPWRLKRESPDPSAFCTWLGGSIPGYVPPNDLVNSKSVVGIKCRNSVVVSGYQINVFTHKLLMEHFIA